ncbi:MAG: hypothetical protein A7315_11350 [Candidatus Altiarchaeales archaeon WOR_SM1_79]|nr:MAG: hypothetical protein A7315_11350 [Candidatus Altiarchaeales archaeon WOR_SM1_79]
MKPKILITDKLHEDAVQEAKSFADVDYAPGLGEDEIAEIIPAYDALIVRSTTRVTKKIIDASNLKVIARAGVGLDNIDLDAAEKRGIEIVNAPTSLTASVAELTFGLMLALLRDIAKADRSMKENKWEKSIFTGTELEGKTLGVIGFGRIGRTVAYIGEAFGMRVIAYDPFITPEDVREDDRLKLVENPDDLLRDADIVSIHCVLTPETKHLINAEKLSLMKKTAVLINIARGPIVDEKALYEALKNKKMKGAALDVYEKEPPKDSPLLKLDNVVLTPHIGASSEEAQRKAGMTVVEEIKKMLA